MSTPSHSLAAPGTPGRVCGTTGLGVCLDAQRFIKLNAVCGIVFLRGGVLAYLGEQGFHQGDDLVCGHGASSR